MTGRAAHAGFNPGAGINAIAAMAEGITQLRQGELPGEMTLNIGKINGGIATNIVSEICECEGEARGFDDALVSKCVDDVEKVFAGTAEKYGAELFFERTENFKAYKINEKHPVVERFKRACGQVGLTPKIVSTRGGSDNNIFSAHGIKGVVIACGMMDSHALSEYTYTRDIEKAAELVYEIIASNF